MACVPVQAPLAVQAVAFAVDQVSVALCPTVTEVGLTEIVTVGAAAVTVSVADACALPALPVQVSVYVVLPLAVGLSLAVPAVACVPVQPPLAVQEVAFVEDQVKFAL
jgi:hypothetical protein